MFLEISAWTNVFFRVVFFNIQIFGDFLALLLGVMWSGPVIDFGKFLITITSNISYSPFSLSSPLAFQL